MAIYQPPQKSHWSGRESKDNLYLHETIQCLTIDQLVSSTPKYAILGYCCDEGVNRNQGRVGAKEGPSAIRRALGKQPNHLHPKQVIVDVGNIVCDDDNLEHAQNLLATTVEQLLSKACMPILIGGGHDIAYGHYNGIKYYLSKKRKGGSIGIINFDAHFDLRPVIKSANSGTPFFQISQENNAFYYLCLGVRKDANDKDLFAIAHKNNVKYVLRNEFCFAHKKALFQSIRLFCESVDYVYVSIDLDGFSSAFAPGVSAASPMGFEPNLVLDCLDLIGSTKKLISFDIAEMNPKYDRDEQTAKLAASLIHHLISF